MKRCPTCGRILPATSYWSDRSRPDGLHWRCKDCARDPGRARAAEWYAAHRDRHISACVERRRNKAAASRGK